MVLPPVSLLNAKGERCYLVMEMGEGVRRSFSIHRGVEFWSTMEGKLLRYNLLELRKTSPDCSAFRHHQALS